MNEQTRQPELRDIIAKKTKLPFDIIDAFINQLFVEIRNNIIDESFLKLEGLGLFRVLKSGDSFRILFIRAKQSEIENLTLAFSKFKENIDQEENKEKVDSIISNDDLEIEDSLSDENSTIIEETIIENDQNESYSQTNSISDNDSFIYIPAKKNKFQITKTLIIIFVIAIIAIIVLVLGMQSKKNNIIYKTSFVELENSDPTSFSYIIIPESDVSLEYVSKAYYGSTDFWPYIYDANEDFVNDHLLIQGGSIIKIPKIMIDIIDYQNGSAVLKAKILGEQIRKEKGIN